MDKIFILEDSNDRIKFFKKVLYNYDLFIYDNVKDACSFLEKNDDFEYMFLDHDLDGKIFVSSLQDNTGYQLAKWLANNKKNVKKIIVHSLNIVGSKNIVELLKKYYNVQYIPYFQLKSIISK